MKTFKVFLLFFIILEIFSVPEEGYAKNKDVDIFYVDYGPKDAPAVLLVQGLGGQLTFWPKSLINLLIDNGFRPIVYDNRDIGLSTSFEKFGKPNFIWNYVKFYLRLPIKSVYSLSDMADDGMAVLDHLNIDKSHLIAQSMGGMISQRMVSTNEDKFISYVLISSMAKAPDAKTAPKGELRSLIETRSFKNLSMDERVNRSLKIYKILASKNDPSFNESEFRKEAISNINRSPNDTGFSRQLIAILADKDRYNEVKNINIPTLVIHGKLDPLIPFEEGKKTADLIANSIFLPVEEMYHLIDEPVINEISQSLVEHLKNNNY